MAGTVEPKSAVYMRSMPCMEEWVRLSIVRPGTSFAVSEYSDGWYRLETPSGEQWWVYAPNRLTNIDTHEVTTSDTHTTSHTSTPVRKPIFSSLKFKRALATINKNYSDAEIVSLVEHFTAIKDEAPELAPMVDYAVEMLQK